MHQTRKIETFFLMSEIHLHYRFSLTNKVFTYIFKLQKLQFLF